MVALRGHLQFGQFLRRNVTLRSDVRRSTHHEFSFSMTSSRTKWSRHWLSVTLLTPRPAGIGNDKYMNELYVVDVFADRYERVTGTRVAQTHLVTRQAFNTVAELALEVVDDEAVVAHLVKLPLLLARKLGRKRLELRLPLRVVLDGRLRQDAIQVLVEPVEQRAQKLLRVVLVRIGKLLREPADRFLHSALVD